MFMYTFVLHIHKHNLRAVLISKFSLSSEIEETTVPVATIIFKKIKRTLNPLNNVVS